jgi:DNA helicase-2/ATP-dependent DNA helicase PcrA
MSIPSRFLEEVPSHLVENLGGRGQAVSSWATPGYPNTYGRKPGRGGDFADKHFNYEDESQEVYNPASAGKKDAPAKPFVASWMTPKAKTTAPIQTASSLVKSAKAPEAGAVEEPNSIDNIARFFGGKAGHGKPGSLPRPAATDAGLEPHKPSATGFKKGQRVRHSKYGEGTVLMREGEGEDAKLTVLFARHGMKKLMEKFANLQKM